MTCNLGYQSKHRNGCVSKITRKVGRLAGLANQLYNKRNFQLWQKKEIIMRYQEYLRPLQMQRLKKPSDSRQRNIILTFIRVIKSVRRSLRRLRRPMPYCLIRIRDVSMISSVMQHLMAQAAEPVALISQAWIWGIFLGTFSEISSEVEEAVAEEMVLHRVQMSVSV